MRRPITILATCALAFACREPAGPCNASADCLADEVCVQERCRKVCNSGGDCPADQFCVEGACLEQPAPPAADATLPGDAGVDSGADAQSPDSSTEDSSAVDAQMTDRETTDTLVADVLAADTLVADVRQADSHQVDSHMPDTRTADAQRPDTLERDASAADVSLPDTSPADSARPDVVPPDWWNLEWPLRSRLSFNNDAQQEALENFPALVVLTAPAFVYDRASVGGRDLRFIEPGSGQVLAHEVELWDEGATSYVWVKVPRIDPSPSSDFIWLYYGNPSTVDAQDPAAVWSNGYVSVWHLGDNPAAGDGAIKDSAAEQQHGTALGMNHSDLVEALIGEGLDFDGANDVVDIEGSGAAGAPLDIVGGPMTLSSLVRPDGNSEGTIIAKRVEWSAQWQLQAQKYDSAESSLSFLWGPSQAEQNNWRTDVTLVADSWNHVAVTVAADGIPRSLYIDGEALIPVLESSASATSEHYDVDVAIGARWTSSGGTLWHLTGLLDEVRVSSVARTDAWMAAEHLAATGALVSVEAAEQLP